jgi:hypothetical protein
VASPSRVFLPQDTSAYHHTGYRSSSGGERSFRYLAGRDGLANRRPRAHRSVERYSDLHGRESVTEYYHDSNLAAHYIDSANRYRPVVYGHGLDGSVGFGGGAHALPNQQLPIIVREASPERSRLVIFKSGDSSQSYGTLIGTRYRSSVGSGYVLSNR